MKCLETTQIYAESTAEILKESYRKALAEWASESVMKLISKDIFCIEPVCSLMGNRFYWDNGLHNRLNITAIWVVRAASATESDLPQRHLTTPNYQRDFLSTEKRVSVARCAVWVPQLANRLFAVSAVATRWNVGKSFSGVGNERAHKSKKNEYPSLLIGDSMCAKNTDTAELETKG